MNAFSPDTLRRKRQATDVMQALTEQQAAFFGLPNNMLLYDRQAVMFSLNELNTPVQVGHCNPSNHINHPLAGRHVQTASESVDGQEGSR